MIRLSLELKRNPDEKNKIEIYKNNKFELEVELLSKSRITGKYDIIIDFIEDMSATLGMRFNAWFCRFLKNYIDNKDDRYDIIKEELETLVNYVDRYMKLKDFDYGQYVDESKAKPSSIFFDEDDIRSINTASCYLKIYSIISNSANYRLSDSAHIEVYNNLLRRVVDDEIITKVFQVIKTKTYRYNISDKFMWKYVKMIQSTTIDMRIIAIFNLIMNNIFILIKPETNPIPYFTTVVDHSIKWFLKEVHKDVIVYEDSISSENVHATPGIDNLKFFCYNDTIGRLKRAAIDRVNVVYSSESGMEPDELFVTELSDRLERVEYISPVCLWVTYPILSELINVPYSHLRGLSPEHSVVLSLYVKYLINTVFSDYFQEMEKLLTYYARNPSPIATTYRLKSSEAFINKYGNNFFGIKGAAYMYSVLSHFVGIISRTQFASILTGKKIVGFPLMKIEQDLVEFFNLFISGNLRPYIDKMLEVLNIDF